MVITGRDFIYSLKPDESRKVGEIAVSRLGDMSQPGEYSVQVMRKAPKDFGDVLVKSNAIRITVTP